MFTVNESGALAGDGAVIGNILNRGTVLPTHITVAGTFNNQGLIAGSGALNAAVLANGTSGQLRTLAGESLQVTGLNTRNAGVIDISGGGQQRYTGALANAPSGRILLNNGVLRLDNGLANSGQVQISFGGATVYGTVNTAGGGKVILSGNSETVVGNSPGPGTDEGSVAFGVASRYTAEIGGNTACTAACAGDDALLRCPSPAPGLCCCVAWA